MIRAFACLQCGASIFARVCDYRPADRAHKKFFKDRQVVRCESCGLVQIDRVPTDTELADFYERAYRSEGFNAEADLAQYPYESPFLLSRGRAIRQLVEQHITLRAVPTILEVGAGYGHNLHAFREKWPDCALVGVEGDPSCAEALTLLRADIVSGFWGDAAIQQGAAKRGPFDVVILAHVLEHVVAPREFVESFRPLLGGGIIALEVPNASSTVMLDSHSPHLTFFDRSSLEALLESAGARIQWIGTCGTSQSVVSDQSPLVWFKRLLPRPMKKFIKRSLGQDDAVKTLTKEQRRNVEAIPIPAFAEYGDGDRPWLRALIQFDEPGRD